MEEDASLRVQPAVLQPALAHLTPLLPPLEGDPITVRFQPRLRAHRGRLLSCEEPGEPVHAAAFIRNRQIVLDAVLLRRRRELARILVHELFHFTWVRLSNAQRGTYGTLLAGEHARQARGELGWSAEWRKRELSHDDWRDRSRLFREYACESFCDTGAFLFAGLAVHAEFTLGASHIERRERLVRGVLPPASVPV